MDALCEELRWRVPELICVNPNALIEEAEETAAEVKRHFVAAIRERYSGLSEPRLLEHLEILIKKPPPTSSGQACGSTKRALLLTDDDDDEHSQLGASPTEQLRTLARSLMKNFEICMSVPTVEHLLQEHRTACERNVALKPGAVELLQQLKSMDRLVFLMCNGPFSLAGWILEQAPGLEEGAWIPLAGAEGTDSTTSQRIAHVYRELDLGKEDILLIEACQSPTGSKRPADVTAVHVSYNHLAQDDLGRWAQTRAHMTAEIESLSTLAALMKRVSEDKEA